MVPAVWNTERGKERSKNGNAALRLTAVGGETTRVTAASASVLDTSFHPRSNFTTNCHKLFCGGYSLWFNPVESFLMFASGP